jgi:polysaccharide pyruvyl transferase WcaK-like protein
MRIALVNDTTLDLHHGCDTVVKNIERSLADQHANLIVRVPVNTKLQDEVFSNIDAIIVNGEGTLHHNQDRAVNLILDLYRVYKYRKLPIYLINATLDSNDATLYQYFGMFRKVYVRDTNSKLELDRYGYFSKVTPDMTFLSSYSKFDTLRAGVGLTDAHSEEISELLYKYSIRNNLRYLPIVHSLKLSKLIKRKISSYICCVFGFVASEKIQKHKYFVADSKKYINIFQGINLLITGRYHSVCFALQTLTPFLAVTSNTHKIESLLKDIGLDSSRLISIGELSQVDLSRSYEYSEQEVLLIENFLIRANSEISLMFEDVFKDLTLENRTGDN